MMLSRLSIRSKIIAVVAFMTIAMTALGVFAVFQMRSINAAAHDIQASWLPSIRWLGEMRSQAARHRGNLRDHMMATDPKVKQEEDKRLEARMKDFGHAVKMYQPLISTDEERALARDLQTAWKEYMASVDEVLAFSRKGDNEMAIATNAATTSDLGRRTEALMSRLIELNDKGAAADGARANATYTLAFWLVVSSLAAVVVLAIAASVLLVRDVSRGIASIIAPMRSLGQGDLTAEVPHQGEKTEIGQMADTLQVFKDALIAKKAADAAAAAEAEAKIQRGQRVDAITREFEAMVGEMVASLSSASTELEAAANTLTSTAETTQQLSGSAASASRDVSDNVQSVAAASEEITSSVNEISRQVQESSRVAQNAVQQAQQTDASIAELSKAAGRIGDVVKLITAVAEQTNLLALNATIEAARAGEAGRGFAVVASEVKALAAQTAKATEEISTQIEGMQSATETSVTAIREIGKTIGTISEISATIAAAVEEQGAATKEIARNMQEAARLSTQVASNVTDVSKGAGETGSASTQVLASAQSLSKESGQLRLEVDKFLTAMRAA
jgi:methyl-accepting chemotaxis protein